MITGSDGVATKVVQACGVLAGHGNCVNTAKLPSKYMIQQAKSHL